LISISSKRMGLTQEAAKVDCITNSPLKWLF